MRLFKTVGCKLKANKCKYRIWRVYNGSFECELAQGLACKKQSGGFHNLILSNNLIYCYSDCKHSPTGICQKRTGLLMLWTQHKKGKQFYKTVVCDDYTPVKKTIDKIK